MNVLLISANPITTPYPVYPLGLDYVAGAIAHRHQVKIADINLTTVDDLSTLIHTFKPEVVGVSLRNVDNTDIENPQTFIDDHRHLCTQIRQFTKATLVLGGSGFTIFPEEILNELTADFGIIGEGERLLYLLDAIETGTDTSRIPGVITPGTPSRIPPPLDNTIRRTITATDGHHRFYLKHGGMLNLQTKRGCPFRCIYCTYPHIEGRCMRLIPPADVAKTATHLIEAGAKYLFITDSAFNADMGHSTAVAQAFIRSGIRVPWGGFFAPIVPPKGYFERLAKAGLTHVEFGTESLSNRVLKAYGKPFTAENVRTAHQRAVAAGLYVAHYILLGGPGETAETLEETLAVIDTFQQTVIFIFCGMRIYPHTTLYHLACREGQITTDQNLLDPVFYRPPGIDTGRIIDGIHSHAENHGNWIFSDGGDESAAVLSKMYRRGFSGPLWEHLIK
jgi:radical SAM superfamily enzyme YgiQ (UPF0313 family)